MMVHSLLSLRPLSVRKCYLLLIRDWTIQRLLMERLGWSVFALIRKLLRPFALRDHFLPLSRCELYNLIIWSQICNFVYYNNLYNIIVMMLQVWCNLFFQPTSPLIDIESDGDNEVDYVLDSQPLGFMKDTIVSPPRKPKSPLSEDVVLGTVKRNLD
jgi:hypothetical protein